MRSSCLLVTLLLLTGCGDKPPPPEPLDASTTLATETAQELVSRLPTRSQNRTPDKGVVERLVSLGDAALEALEREYRLDLEGRGLQSYMDSGVSRRAAVIEVLVAMTSAGSTDLLVRTLSREADTWGSRDTALRALAERELTEDQVVTLLANYKPDAVLLGLHNSIPHADDGKLREAILHVFDKEQARTQFRNVFGSPMATADQLWAVRLAAGRALGADMLPEMQQRAAECVDALRTALTQPAQPNAYLDRLQVSEREVETAMALDRLADLGSAVRDVVARAATSADEPLRAILDLGLFVLGDSARLPSVTATLLEDPEPWRRVCAARALARVKDHRSISFLWKALEDPYHRPVQSCLPAGDHYPVRDFAERALIAMGEDATAVRAAALRSADAPR